MKTLIGVLLILYVLSFAVFFMVNCSDDIKEILKQTSIFCLCITIIAIGVYLIQAGGVN